MNGKEEKWLDALRRTAAMSGDAGLILQGVADGALSVEEGEEQMRALTGEYRGPALALREKAVRAFQGRSEDAAAHLLSDAVCALLPAADALAERLRLCPDAADENRTLMTELAARALREWARLAVYDPAEAADAARAAARAQKIRNYEARGREGYLDGVSALYRGNGSPLSVLAEKDVYDACRQVLRLAADAAGLYEECVSSIR